MAPPFLAAASFDEAILMQELLSALETGLAATAAASLFMHGWREAKAFTFWLTAWCAVSFIEAGPLTYAAVSVLALTVVGRLRPRGPAVALAGLAAAPVLASSAIASAYVALFVYCAVAAAFGAAAEAKARPRIILEAFAAWHATQAAALFALWTPHAEGHAQAFILMAILLSCLVFIWLVWRLNRRGLESEREEAETEPNLDAVAAGAEQECYERRGNR